MMNNLSAASLSRQESPSTVDPRRRAFDILSRVAADRGRVYRWLAIGFYPPDASLIAALNTGHMVDEIQASIAWLGEDRAKLQAGLSALQRFVDATLADLEADYARLFGKSVERVSPRESAYRWRDASDVLSATETIAQALRQQYTQFNTVPMNGHEDHVAVELEFLAFLCEREAASWASGAQERARQLRRQERVFLDDHLGRWLAEFCWRVCDRLPDTFYAALADLGDVWLSLEHGPGYLPATASNQ